VCVCRQPVLVACRSMAFRSPTSPWRADCFPALRPRLVAWGREAVFVDGKTWDVQGANAGVDAGAGAGAMGKHGGEQRGSTWSSMRGVADQGFVRDAGTPPEGVVFSTICGCGFDGDVWGRGGSVMRRVWWWVAQIQDMQHFASRPDFEQTTILPIILPSRRHGSQAIDRRRFCVFKNNTCFSRRIVQCSYKEATPSLQATDLEAALILFDVIHATHLATPTLTPAPTR